MERAVPLFRVCSPLSLRAAAASDHRPPGRLQMVNPTLPLKPSIRFSMAGSLPKHGLVSSPFPPCSSPSRRPPPTAQVVLRRGLLVLASTISTGRLDPQIHPNADLSLRLSPALDRGDWKGGGSGGWLSFFGEKVRIRQWDPGIANTASAWNRSFIPKNFILNVLLKSYNHPDGLNWHLAGENKSSVDLGLGAVRNLKDAESSNPSPLSTKFSTFSLEGSALSL